MKTKIYNYLNRPYTVILTMLITPIFGFIDRNFVFFFGLGIAILILYKSQFDWKKFGIGKKINLKTIIKSLLISIVLFIVFNIFIGPVLQSWFGEYDLSSIEGVRGNFISYIILMIVIWVFAAFGEEFLFRGYYMKAMAELLGDNNKAWLFSALITSIYFGISHAYQGIAGVISVFLYSICISLLFYKNKNNLLLLVLIHGFNDSIGITLMYLNKDYIIYNWADYILQLT